VTVAAGTGWRARVAVVYHDVQELQPGEPRNGSDDPAWEDTAKSQRCEIGQTSEASGEPVVLAQAFGSAAQPEIPAENKVSDLSWRHAPLNIYQRS